MSVCEGEGRSGFSWWDSMKPHMSPEAAARHNRELQRQLQLLEADTPIVLADAIHAYHNCMMGQFTSESYEGLLYRALLPELMRRLAGTLPERCPTCQSLVDWPFPERSTELSNAEVTLLRAVVELREKRHKTKRTEYLHITQVWQWDASKRLVGRGLLRRDPKTVHRVQVTDAGIRQCDLLGVGWWEGL